MRHPKITTTLGLCALGFFGFQANAAFAASPVGYWLKEDGAAKLQISKCGNDQLCSKIVWLRNPYDSQGKPLHDARNDNPTLRNRPIIGLSIFNGLVHAGRDVWKGQIYNPEDGGTFKATLTLVTPNQVNLKGCLAMFLCGQKTWTRTTFTPPQPAQPPAPREIQVKTKPRPITPPAAKPRTIEASVAGVPVDLTTGSINRTAHAHQTASLNQNGDQDPRILHPVLPPAREDATAGYGLVLTTASPEAPPKLDENDPSSMYLVSPTPPPPPVIIDASTAPSPVQRHVTPASYVQHERVAPAPVRPRVKTPAATAAAAMPMPAQRPLELDLYAEMKRLSSQGHLTWRERRRLRRLRRELPWLQQAEKTAAQSDASVATASADTASGSGAPASGTAPSASNQSMAATTEASAAGVQ